LSSSTSSTSKLGTSPYHLLIPRYLILTILYSGPTLEEIARIFDGDNAEVGDVKTDVPGLSNVNYDKESINMHEKA
jgi:hypothetical protein